MAPAAMLDSHCRTATALLIVSTNIHGDGSGAMLAVPLGSRRMEELSRKHNLLALCGNLSYS